MKQPTILLAVPYLYGLDKCIEKNLEYYGFKVINLCYDDRDSYYPNFLSRLIAFFYKYILKDQNYKKKLKFIRYERDIDDKLSTLNGKKADYALCIRANIYPLEIIQKIRWNTKYCINYQWDGINRFPDILNYVDYFDKFFTFDETDVKKYPEYDFSSASNFYFDFPLNIQENLNNSIYFLGGYAPLRSNDMNIFINEARRLNLPLDFYISCKDERAKQQFGETGITYLNRNSVFSFEENLNNVRNCSVVVDFVSPDHTGLSFRTFDALCFCKKLITTNATVRNYAFYHPNNIFIWDGKNLDGIIEFLELPYYEIDHGIKVQYSFRYWLNKILDLKTVAIKK